MLQAGAGAAALDIKKEHLVDECKPAASFISSDAERTAMSRPVNAIAFLCSIFDVDFGNLVEEHDLGARKDLSWKVDFVPVDPS